MPVFSLSLVVETSADGTWYLTAAWLGGDVLSGPSWEDVYWQALKAWSAR